ncbi:hypothetical protein [Litorimonas haliclonae]|uniref:hypothetical protein n=1 Tax=Litorimonas haliclonae TaxID=2081977 RepID=UPI0039F0AEB1
MKKLVKNDASYTSQVNELAIAANDLEPAYNKTAKVNEFSESVKQRVADLEWQIRFTQIQLNRWHALENGSWTSLKALQKAAKSELNSLMLQ